MTRLAAHDQAPKKELTDARPHPGNFYMLPPLWKAATSRWQYLAGLGAKGSSWLGMEVLKGSDNADVKESKNK